MKSALKVKVSYLARNVKKDALKKAGASPYLIRKIKHHARLSSRMEKRSMQIYRNVQYRAIKASGLNPSESRRYYNEKPFKISSTIKFMDMAVRTIEKVYRVKETERKTEKQALNAIRKALSKKEWSREEIEDYLKVLRAAGVDNWRKYKRYCTKHGTISYETWKHERDLEAADHALHVEAAKKGWRRRKYYH